MAKVSMTVEEYLDLIAKLRQGVEVVKETREIVQRTDRKVKRKVSSYNRKYKAAFKKVKSSYMTKSGKWKKGGFQRAVKAAHRMVKK
tara:strand:- start:1025 stop:1285 length:261 start_codon:yes stop_codon:yes gene_type:complete